MVGTLRDALIRDWGLLSKDQKTELQQYLFQFMMRERNIAMFVRERILQVIIYYLLYNIKIEYLNIIKFSVVIVIILIY